MRYYIKRDLNEYGPYTLADLQRYVAQGNIVLTDLARSEGMTDWAPVSQILGSIPVAAPPLAAPQPPAATPANVYAGTPQMPAPVYGQPPVAAPAYAAAPAVVTAPVPGPVPPDFHWALVLVIGFFCSVFQIVWLFIEASFVKKIRPNSNFMTFLITGLVVTVVSAIVAYASIIAAVANNSEPPAALLLLCVAAYLAGIVLSYVGIFKMRSAIREYYNTVEPINLRLSGVMTFFFNVLYFQYHFSRIAQWKKTGYLQPQG